MSRPSPLEHLPRLMAEADATIAKLRTQLADEQTASESLRNQVDVLGKGKLELQRELEQLRADFEAAIANDTVAPARAWREGSLTTEPQPDARDLERARNLVELAESIKHDGPGMFRMPDGTLFVRVAHYNFRADLPDGREIYVGRPRDAGEVRVAAEQLVRIDGVLIRGRRRKDGRGYDHLNVELVDEPVTIGATISTVVDRSSSKDVSVEIAGRKLELGPPISGALIESPPGWMDDADLRELVEAMQTTLREQPAAVYLTLPRESVELIVRIATAPVLRAPRSSAELEQLKAAAREQIASGALNVITTDDGEHDVRELPPCPSCSKPALAIDRIGSSIRRVNDENGMPGHAVRINTPGLVRHADGTTCQVPSFDAAAPAMREAFERVRSRTAMRDRIGRRIFGDETVAATAATLLLELVQTLRARLSHASTELRHRSEPAPEVDDVGAACAVLAEDLDGIIAEVDHVLQQVPR